MKSEWPAWARANEELGAYYATEWGMPIGTEAGVFERLSLEIFQSGLSWRTILAKRDAFREAFAGFDPDAVAAYTDADIERLLGNEKIVRNKRKILATITNANATISCREITSPYLNVDPGLPALVWGARPADHTSPTMNPASTSPESTELARSLKKHGFVHVGPTNVYAMMQALGVVNDHPQGSVRQRETRSAVDSFLTPLRAGATT